MGEQVDANEEQSGENACEESVDKQLGGVWLRGCVCVLFKTQLQRFG